jgi:hypothetical protein
LIYVSMPRVYACQPTPGAIHRHREAAKEPAIVDEGSASKVQTRALLPVAIPRAQNNLSRALRNKCMWRVGVCVWVVGAGAEP